MVWMNGVALATLLSALTAPAVGDELKSGPSLAEIYAGLSSKKFVDLTHSFGTESPHWKGFAPMRRRTVFTIEQDGFTAEEFCHVGQWGTHVDPPAHFHAGLRTVDQIDPKEMLLPLVLIDVRSKVAENPDYVVSLNDLLTWEKRHGRIPPKSFVALRTDWSKRWPDAAAMQNVDAAGIAHFPGWSIAVLRALYEERQVTATGHETTDTDPGIAVSKGDASLESYVLGLDHYQIELLANLDKVPESGALVIVSFPKPLSGTGFPARVIGILP